MNNELQVRIRAIVEGLRDVAALAEELEHVTQAAQGVAGSGKGTASSLRDTGTAAGEAATGLRSARSEADKSFKDPTGQTREGLRSTEQASDRLREAMKGLAAGLALGGFLKASIDAVSQAENSFRGLEAVANHVGIGIGKAFQAAEQLSSDGLISVAEASKSLQNLLSRGYNLDQAVQTLNHLKDAAAFNRAAHLSMGEAVVTATEGLKNENSTLVDNAGVTKNVSVIWKEYATSIGKTAGELTQQEKIQAEVSGILKETAAQAGNAAKAQEGLQGKTAQLKQAMNELQVSVGAALIPSLQALVQVGNAAIENVLKPLLHFFAGLGARAANTAADIDAIFTAIKTLDFSGLHAKLKQNERILEETLSDMAAQIESGVIPAAKQLAKVQGDAADAAVAGAAAQRKAAEEVTQAEQERAAAVAGAAHQIITAGLGIKDSSEKGADAIKSLIESGKLVSGDGPKILAEALAKARTEGKATDEEIRQGLVQTLRQLTDIQLTEFREKATASFSEPGADLKELGTLLDAVLTVRLNRIGLDLEELRTGASQAGRALVENFREIATVSEQSSAVIGRSFDATLAKLKNPQDIHLLRTALEEAFAAGKIGAEEFQSKLDELTIAESQAAIQAQNTATDVGRAFAELGIRSDEELSQAVDNAIAAFNRMKVDANTSQEEIARAAAAVGQKITQAYDGTVPPAERAKLAAAGIGDSYLRSGEAAKQASADTVKALGDQETAIEQLRSGLKQLTDVNQIADFRNELTNAFRQGEIAANEYRDTLEEVGGIQKNLEETSQSAGRSLISLYFDLRAQFRAFGTEAEDLFTTIIRQHQSVATSFHDFFGLMAEASRVVKAKVASDTEIADRLLKTVENDLQGMESAARGTTRAIGGISGSLTNARAGTRGLGDDLRKAENELSLAEQGFRFLDAQHLAGLRSAIDSLRQKLASLRGELSQTVDQLKDELDQLRGDEADIEKRDFERQKAELAQKAQQAKGDPEAERKVREAQQLLEQVHKERVRALEEEEAARKAADAQHANDRPTRDNFTVPEQDLPDRPPPRPGGGGPSPGPSPATQQQQVIRLQFVSPSGTTGNGGADSHGDVNDILRVLEESGATVNA